MRFFREIIAVALVAAVIGGIALGVRGIIRYRSVSDEVFYNDTIIKKIYGSGLERLQHDNSKLFLGPKTDQYFDIYEGDTLAIYSLDGKYGFLNIVTGEDMISSAKHNFEYAWHFDHESGLAAVIEGGKIGFIRKDGSYQIKPQYSFNYWSLEDFDCEFKNGYCIVPSGHKVKFGLIDKGNKVFIPFIYDSIGDLEKGYRIIALDSKYGLVDSLSNVKISPAYDDISISQLGIVLLDAKKHSQELLGFDLKTVISKYAFDDVSPIFTQENSTEDEYDYETASSPTGYSSFTLNDNVGVIRNLDGKVIIDAVWDEIEFFGKDIFKAGLNGKYFLLDKTGKFIH
jgi:hypothetical protein